MLSWQDVPLFLLIVASVLTCPAYPAAAVDTLPLQKAVSSALENNPDLSALRARYDAYKNVPSQEGSLPDPVLSFNALNLPVDTFSLDQEAMTQMQVKLTQSIPFPGKLSLKKAAAVRDQEGLGFQIEELKQQISGRVEQAWWELFYLEKALGIVEKNKKYLQEMVDVARSRYEVGKGLQSDVLLAQVELTGLFNEEAGLRGRLGEMKARLARLMGRSDAGTFEIPLAEEVALPPPPSESALLKKAKATRPLLRAKKETIGAAEARLALARKGYLPDFALGAAYGFRQDSPEGRDRPDFASFMIAVNIPLWAGTKQSRRIDQKHLEVLEKKRIYRSSLEKMQQEISAALDVYKSSFRQARLYRDAVIPQARQTFAAMLSAYRVNKVDFLNVIRARLALIKYERLYWRSVADARKALAGLKAASGTYQYAKVLKNHGEPAE